jgi:hypothetical protein
MISQARSIPGREAIHRRTSREKRDSYLAVTGLDPQTRGQGAAKCYNSPTAPLIRSIYQRPRSGTPNRHREIRTMRTFPILRATAFGRANPQVPRRDRPGAPRPVRRRCRGTGGVRIGPSFKGLRHRGLLRLGEGTRAARPLRWGPARHRPGGQSARLLGLGGLPRILVSIV